MSEEGKKNKPSFVCEFELSVCAKCGSETRYLDGDVPKCSTCNIRCEISHNLHDPKSGEWKKSKVCVNG